MASTAQQSSSVSSSSVQSLGNAGNRVEGQSPVEIGYEAKRETPQGVHGENEALMPNVGSHVGMLVSPHVTSCRFWTAQGQIQDTSQENFGINFKVRKFPT